MLIVESHEGVTKVTLDRPERRNALSEELLTVLGSKLEELSRDANTRVIVLGSNGTVFCSGHDLGEMVGRSEAEYQTLFMRCSAVMQQIRKMPQPVIARVQGLATAAGCQLVAACDLAVAAVDARFATPGVKIGLFCSTPMVPLARAIPAKFAMEMLLTGISISADRAMELGLINRVVPVEDLDKAIQEFTIPILASSPMTIRMGKQAFYKQLNMDEPSAYECATKVMTENAIKHDAQEGISAFLQKRPANWTGQ